MNVYIIKAIEPKKKKNESKAEHQVPTEESYKVCDELHCFVLKLNFCVTSKKRSFPGCL